MLLSKALLRYRCMHTVYAFQNNSALLHYRSIYVHEKSHVYLPWYMFVLDIVVWVSECRKKVSFNQMLKCRKTFMLFLYVILSYEWSGRYQRYVRDITVRTISNITIYRLVKWNDMLWHLLNLTAWSVNILKKSNDLNAFAHVEFLHDHRAALAILMVI